MDIEKLDSSQLSFEEALKNLELIVKTLEDGSASLEQAIALYEKGMSLKKHCEEKLAEATLKVEQILVSGTDDISIQVTHGLSS